MTSPTRETMSSMSKPPPPPPNLLFLENPWIQCNLYNYILGQTKECTIVRETKGVMVGPDKPAIPGQWLFRACWLSSAGNTHHLSGTPPSFIYTQR